MAVYRYQVVSVGLWRGKIKRWNTTFHAPEAGYLSLFHSSMQAAGYPNPGDTVGACSGGVASISRYNAAGGPPLEVVTYFDWQSPSTWIPYTGSAWIGVPSDTPIDASGESALLVVGTMAGLSSTGKPVTTRKYLHAIPSRSAVDYTDPDVSMAQQTAIKNVFPTYLMGNPSGSYPLSVDVEPYYYNHQRVRGRRRSRSEILAGGFAAGVVTGAEATQGSGGAPFQ